MLHVEEKDFCTWYTGMPQAVASAITLQYRRLCIKSPALQAWQPHSDVQARYQANTSGHT